MKWYPNNALGQKTQWTFIGLGFWWKIAYFLWILAKDFIDFHWFFMNLLWLFSDFLSISIKGLLRNWLIFYEFYRENSWFWAQYAYARKILLRKFFEFCHVKGGTLTMKFSLKKHEKMRENSEKMWFFELFREKWLNILSRFWAILARKWLYFGYFELFSINFHQKWAIFELFSGKITYFLIILS